MIMDWLPCGSAELLFPSLVVGCVVLYFGGLLKLWLLVFVAAIECGWLLGVVLIRYPVVRSGLTTVLLSGIDVVFPFSEEGWVSIDKVIV